MTTPSNRHLHFALPVMLLSIVATAACAQRYDDAPVANHSAASRVSGDHAQDCDASTCPAFLGDCSEGYVPADLDGDGCIDGCAPTTCPPFMPDCSEGYAPTDTDGDGCPDRCAPL